MTATIQSRGRKERRKIVGNVVKSVGDLERYVGKIVKAEGGKALYERESDLQGNDHRLIFVPDGRYDAIRIHYGNSARILPNGVVSVFDAQTNVPYIEDYCKMSTNSAQRHVHDLLSERLQRAGVDMS